MKVARGILLASLLTAFAGIGLGLFLALTGQLGADRSPPTWLAGILLAAQLLVVAAAVWIARGEEGEGRSS